MTLRQQNFVAILATFALLFMWTNSKADFPEEIPFVPTPSDVVDRMLELAEVKKGDVVYDLGSGDGRIVIRAAKKYGVRAVGIEMDRLLLAQARKDAKALGVSHLVEFRAEDAMKVDLSKATVVTLYMLPWFNEAMKPSFKKYLKPMLPPLSGRAEVTRIRGSSQLGSRFWIDGRVRKSEAGRHYSRVAAIFQRYKV